MGIFVSEGVLPSGVPISNVYMSFSGSLVYVEPKDPNGLYFMRSTCKAFKDQASKSHLSDVSFQVAAQVSEVSIGGKCVYEWLYDKLKDMFPGSQDAL